VAANLFVSIVVRDVRSASRPPSAATTEPQPCALNRHAACMTIGCGAAAGSAAAASAAASHGGSSGSLAARPSRNCSAEMG